jgi:hypothetical protein
MKVEIAAGIEADLASTDELNAVGKGVNDRLDSLFGAVKAPREFYIRAAGTADPTSSTAPTIIPFQPTGPPDGMEWEVRMVLVQYISDAGVTGVWGAAQSQPVAVLVSAMPSNALTAADAVDLAVATPVSFLYPTSGLVVQAPESLYVGVLASAAQVAGPGQFVVTARSIMPPIRSQSDIQKDRP